MSGTKSKQNKGEKAEYNLKKKLFTLNKNGNFKELIKILDQEADEGIILLNLKTKEEIQNIEDIEDKAGKNYKADTMIKMKKTGEIYSISIKCDHGGTPSILNHTPRSANIFQKGSLSSSLSKIDNLIQKYHKYRGSPGGTEEVKLSGIFLETLDDENKTILIKVIRTFMFAETGKGPSECPANCLLVINKYGSYTFKKLETIEKQNEYIEQNLSKFDIALVSRKGLPKKIKTKSEAEEKCKTDKKYKIKYNQMEPWIYETNKSKKPNPENKIFIKAALHIRMSN